MSTTTQSNPNDTKKQFFQNFTSFVKKGSTAVKEKVYSWINLVRKHF